MSILQDASVADIRRLIRLLDSKPAVYMDEMKSMKEDAMTTLMLAIDGDHFDIAVVLLNKVDIDSRDKITGDTALIFAVRKQKPEFVKMLLRNHANMYMRNLREQDAMMVASSLGDTMAVRILIEQGFKINISNRFGNTSLISSIKTGRLEVVKLLLKHGAVVNKKNSEGKTPLHYSCQMGYELIALALVSAGADYMIEDHNGANALSACLSVEMQKNIIRYTERRYFVVISCGIKCAHSVFRTLMIEQYDVWKQVFSFI